MRRIVDRLKIGFSILELMTALTVFGILVVIAVPTYREHQIRARMVDVVATLQNVLDQAKQDYVSSQTIPVSVQGLASGVATAYNSSKCVEFVTYDNGSAWTNAGRGAMVQGYLSSTCGQGIPGFVPGTSGAFNVVTVGFLVVGEQMQQFCGTWANDGTQVPIEYLPTGCQNEAFASTLTGD